MQNINQHPQPLYNYFIRSYLVIYEVLLDNLTKTHIQYMLFHTSGYALRGLYRALGVRGGGGESRVKPSFFSSAKKFNTIILEGDIFRGDSFWEGEGTRLQNGLNILTYRQIDIILL